MRKLARNRTAVIAVTRRGSHVVMQKRDQTQLAPPRAPSKHISRP